MPSPSSHGSTFVPPLPLAASPSFFSCPASLSRTRPTSRSLNSTRPIAMFSSYPSLVDLPPRVSRSVVWFRTGDLRTQDHPGLSAAMLHTSDAMAPLFILTPSSSPADLSAASRLYSQLKSRGSTLFIRFSHNEAIAVAQFVSHFQADRIHVRMDAEYEARHVVNAVERLTDGIATVFPWTTELREWDDADTSWLASVPELYPKFLRWHPRRTTPIISSDVDFLPEVILPAPGVDASEPDFDMLARKLHIASTTSKQRREFEERVAADDEFVRAFRTDPDRDDFGEAVVREYLSRSDNYSCPDLGRSLAEVFRQGALSPRRIYEIVVAHERKNGRIWRFVYRDGANLLLDFLNAREFATLMARKAVEGGETVDGLHEAKFWRWKGYLIRYVEEGRENAGGKPPLLLVHGFGASSQHYWRSVRVLKEKYHVFALDMIGFGRSEKPPMQYTQDLWELLLWDFVRNVVKQPVYIGGNSIGGYFSACFGADSFGDLCEGVCLINSSGKLVDGARRPRKSEGSGGGLFKYVMREWRAARLAAGKVLLRSLQGRVAKTLKFVYPVNPETADEQLAQNIVRDSFDYGAADVLASGLILPPPRSLTELLQKYQGPLLVFQGDLDPLNDASGRAEKIRKQYPTSTVVHVQAGHCPHEEVCEKFVEAISAWMDTHNAAKVTRRSGAVGEMAEERVVPDTRHL
eukprot:GFKZ01000960.1.p1 GENE.GFKZ01000960.1~~GFKZ01000960.1.p1  ORF type:complete len:692 (+),score=79.85 GFKZ01000960.1:3651-5726(+)